MSILICVFGNVFERVLELANVNARGTKVFMQIHSQFLQVIVGILAAIQIVPELLLLLKPPFFFPLLLGSLCSLRLQEELMLCLLVVNILFTFLLLLGSLLNLAVLQQPISEVFDWIARFLGASGCQTLGEDQTDLLLFEICNV